MKEAWKYMIVYFISGIGTIIWMPLGFGSLSVFQITLRLFLFPYTIVSAASQGFLNLTLVMMFSAILFGLIGYWMAQGIERLSK